jgi:glycosyltransferase involved in cell wall biosynthesis
MPAPDRVSHRSVTPTPVQREASASDQIVESDRCASSAPLGGVSIVVCCYNSAPRLPAALARLRSQRDTDAISWEIIVVDNGSNDDTAAVARGLWPRDDRVPLTVITEPRRGVAFAREAGFEAARYEFVSFIDDDNWVCDRWVARVAQVMGTQGEVGACGGYSDAICEGPAPTWFERYREYYAIGPPASAAGTSPATLWFAGLTVRTEAWRTLRRGGFRFLTVTAAEDNEFTLALRLAGWRLWLDDELRMKHVLPQARLTWPYFCAMQRSRFASMVAVDPYRLALDDDGDTRSRARFSKTWLGQMTLTAKALMQNLVLRPRKVLWPHDAAFEGDDDVFRIELYRGRLRGLMRHRRDYDANVRSIATAAWRDTGPAART